MLHQINEANELKSDDEESNAAPEEVVTQYSDLDAERRREDVTGHIGGLGPKSKTRVWDIHTVKKESVAERVQREEREAEARRLYKENQKKTKEEDSEMSKHAEKYKQLLSDGQVLLKHGRQGKPHPRQIFAVSQAQSVRAMSDSSSSQFDDDNTQAHTLFSDIFWCDPGKRSQDKTKWVVFNEFTKITKGKKTPVFERSTAKDSPEDCCFSVEDNKRSLDLQADSPEDRDLWISALMWAQRAYRRN